MQTPLLVLIFRLGMPQTSKPYSDSFRTVIGLGEMAAPVDATQLLNVTELREFNLQPDPNGGGYLLPQSIPSLVSAAESIFVIILDGQTQGAAVENTAFEQMVLQAVSGKPLAAVLSVFLNIPGSLLVENPQRLTRLGMTDLDERDLRVPLFTLRALHGCLSLLIVLNRPGAAHAARFFFSHAKKDGVEIATALLDWMKRRLRGFESFYDTENLDLNQDIDLQLSTAVQNAVIIIFRTEVFDQRYWCQKEALWAEKFGRPVVTVDARWQLQHGASVISFDSVPAVRIPDGSIARILSAALHEAVRIELFNARMAIRTRTISHRQVAVIPRCPSLVSIDESVRLLGMPVLPTHLPPCIVYPNPALPEMLLAAGRELARGRIPTCELLSLDEFTRL